MKDYLDPFYIFNICLCLVYPLLRNYGTNINLDIKDSLGYKKEQQIIALSAIIIMMRFIFRFLNWKKFIHDFFFYSKLAISVLTLLINYKICCWYIFFCISVWILFRPPKYNGNSEIYNIQNEEAFIKLIIKNEQVGFLNKRIKNKKNYWVIILYSNFSDDCIYTEELLSKLSMKYSSDNIKFGRINVDNNFDVLEKMYQLKISGFNCQLPQLILFEDGRDIKYFPPLKTKYHFFQFYKFREKEIVKLFNLSNLQ